MASTNVCVCLRHVDQVWTVLQSPHMVSCTNYQSQLCHWLYSSEKRWGGQKGIVSTIAMVPSHSHMYAVGSYSSQGKTHTVPPVHCDGVCSVGVYSDLADGAVLLLTGVGGGVTHIAVSPDGNLLFVGFRKVCSQLLSPGNEPSPLPQSNELKVWDLRNPGNQLAQLHRPVYTNQRLYFDLYRQVFVFIHWRACAVSVTVLCLSVGISPSFLAL